MIDSEVFAVDTILNEVCVLVTVAFALTLVPGLQRPERSLLSRRDQNTALLVFLFLGLVEEATVSHAGFLAPPHHQVRTSQPQPGNRRRGRLNLPTLRFAAAPELQVQLFNRWFDPQTMLPCGPGNAVMRNCAFIGTTTESGPRCARYQGAYVERVADGRLLHVLSHGVGVSHAIAAQGRLVAIGGVLASPASLLPSLPSLGSLVALLS